MMIKLYEKNNDPRRLDRIVAVLNDGGVVIYPTGTTYALGCHALKERAVERICRIRNIDPVRHPLSVICYDMSAVSEYARISTAVYKMMRRNLPGPFTFVLPGLSRLPRIFRNRGGAEVGIRMPVSTIVREVLERLGAPLMTASLPENEDGSEYQTDPELVEETFGRLVDLVIDGGPGRPGMTTIVDCTGEIPEIVRQGDGELI